MPTINFILELSLTGANRGFGPAPVFELIFHNAARDGRSHGPGLFAGRARRGSGRVEPNVPASRRLTLSAAVPTFVANHVFPSGAPLA